MWKIDRLEFFWLKPIEMEPSFGKRNLESGDITSELCLRSGGWKLFDCGNLGYGSRLKIETGYLESRTAQARKSSLWARQGWVMIDLIIGPKGEESSLDVESKKRETPDLPFSGYELVHNISCDQIG